jgi:hypothetical protein
MAAANCAKDWLKVVLRTGANKKDIRVGVHAHGGRSRAAFSHTVDCLPWFLFVRVLWRCIWRPFVLGVPHQQIVSLWVLFMGWGLLVSFCWCFVSFIVYCVNVLLCAFIVRIELGVYVSVLCNWVQVVEAKWFFGLIFVSFEFGLWFLCTGWKIALNSDNRCSIVCFCLIPVLSFRQ